MLHSQYEALVYEIYDSQSTNVSIIPAVSDLIKVYREDIPKGLTDLDIILNLMPEYVDYSSVTNIGNGDLILYKGEEWIPDLTVNVRFDTGGTVSELVSDVLVHLSSITQIFNQFNSKENVDNFYEFFGPSPGDPWLLIDKASDSIFHTEFAEDYEKYAPYLHLPDGDPEKLYAYTETKSSFLNIITPGWNFGEKVGVYFSRKHFNFSRILKI